MEINIQSTVSSCTEFLDEQGERREVSVVISPLKVSSDDSQNRIKVITGCNLWKACFNGDCYFSIKARSSKRQ